jgi:ribosomal protein S18 acetylase RimI-like enzyme
MKPEVSTRTLHLPDDAELLLSVYRSTRENEAALFGWTEDEVSRFIRFQFDAQSSYYARYFPRADHSVVLVGSSPAGRLVVDRSENAVHIIDISLLASVRRRGVGTELVHRLLAEAEGRGVPATCHVEAGNQARSFWQRLGFIEGPADGAYISLERPCGISRR